MIKWEYVEGELGYWDSEICDFGEEHRWFHVAKFGPVTEGQYVRDRLLNEAYRPLIEQQLRFDVFLKRVDEE